MNKTPLKPGEASQRQLRVGEEIRHALAAVFLRGDTHIAELESTSVTVSEVRVSPDLKHATAYIITLGGAHVDVIVDILNEHCGEFRHQVTRQVAHLRYSPKIRFKKDESFEEAQKISNLMRDPRVQRDIAEAQGRENDA
ncbi:MAG: 30S ribosome-binding factor RbfA [Rickettsiales bacterium]|nr:30S ribosome-binding factor RbfA [Rickettsiales bacterium]